MEISLPRSTSSSSSQLSNSYITYRAVRPQPLSVVLASSPNDYPTCAYFPLYDRPKPSQSKWCHSKHSLRSVEDKLMKTVDHRYDDEPSKELSRSSFALQSDVFENGRFEISDVLPSTSSDGSSSLCESKKKAHLRNKMTSLVVFLHKKCQRFGLRSVKNKGSNNGLDLSG
ncbi:hypothetical protein ABKN59_001537 [Abortiporus biennis]